MNKTLTEILSQMPLVAILRGLTPKRATDTAEILADSGIGIMEVPLNSPHPFDSIERIANRLSDRVVVGAGTVLSTENVGNVANAGGKIIVSPNTQPDVIASAIEQGLEPIPGIATPTEAFAAIHAGARLLKVFPAQSIGPEFFRHIRAVLPDTVGLLAVGGVEPDNFDSFLEAGAIGVGTGSSLFRPTLDRKALASNAAEFTARARQYLQRSATSQKTEEKPG